MTDVYGADTGGAMTGAEALGMQAETKKPSWDDMPEVDEQRAELIKEWEDKIKDAKKFWKKFYQRTRDCEQLAFAGADKAWIESDSYTVPVIPRHINQSVATLYAKRDLDDVGDRVVDRELSDRSCGTAARTDRVVGDRHERVAAAPWRGSNCGARVD